MRSSIIFIAATGLLTLGASAALAASDGYAEASRLQAGTAYTPSGMGEPDAIVCRAPQTLAGGGPGPKICLHNNVWARLTLDGKDLAADGHSVFERPMVEEPNGEGIADAVTCRKPQEITTGWHLRNTGPEICLTNGTWAQLKADHKVISEDGQGIIDTRMANQPLPGPMGSFNPGLSQLPVRTIH